MAAIVRGKRVRRAAWGAIALGAMLLGLFLTQSARVAYPLERLTFTAAPGTWRGVYHVHTVASDGSGTIEDVVAAARASGAAWVIVTDHNVMDGPRARILDGVLVVQAPEVSSNDGHVVALGASRALRHPERRSRMALGIIRALGGTTVAAHPLGRKRPYTRLDDPLLEGLEILSADQEFRDALVDLPRLLPAALAYTVNPQHAIMRLLKRPDRTLARWDELLASRRMAGFCAPDAHGVPPYAAMFASLQMHAEVGHPPTGGAEADGAALVAALAAGRSFCGIEAIGGAGGFSFTGVDDEGRAGMGGSLRRGRHPVLAVGLAYPALPEGARPVMYCGGAPVPLAGVVTPSGWRYEYRPVSAGACRVEVLVEDGNGGTWPWILSNPIYVE